MKKVKVFLVGILTLVLSLFCLVGCFKTGVYKATAIKTTILGATTTTELEPGEDSSYIELKSDNVAVVSINLSITKIETTGTWTEGEDGKVMIETESGVDYTVTIDGSTMTLDLGSIGQIIFEKE